MLFIVETGSTIVLEFGESSRWRVVCLSKQTNDDDDDDDDSSVLVGARC